MRKWLCDWQVDQFLQICAEIRFPVSLEKMYWGTSMLVFLGFLINTVNQVVCIPTDKIQKALEIIELFLKSQKVTVHQVQHLCGTLNFLCRCVVPARALLEDCMQWEQVPIKTTYSSYIIMRGLNLKINRI